VHSRLAAKPLRSYFASSVGGAPSFVLRQYIEQCLIMTRPCLAAFTTGLKATHRRPYW
jgi:hypothetical protein